jgi:hypothetical protein
MTDLIQLSDAEIAAVAGGAVDQAINISASQSNSSTLTQTATASGRGASATAIGAAATNVASVTQSNTISAANLFRRG